MTTGIALGGLAVGAGSWAVNYFFRKDTFLRDHLMKAQLLAEGRMQTVRKDLEKNLKDSGLSADTNDYAKQALQQYELMQNSFENFRHVLVEKLNPDEITFSRFLTTAEQVNLAVLDSLQSIATRLKSIGAIDPKYIESRILALEKLKKREPTDEDELKTLLARKNLRDEQMTKVNEILTYNEEALTQLAKANAAIVEMKGKHGHSSMELADATSELEEIAKRARKF
jgi:hypothetical protein